MSAFSRLRDAWSGYIQRRLDYLTDQLNHHNEHWRETEYWRGYEAGYQDGKDITEAKLLGNRKDES